MSLRERLEKIRLENKIEPNINESNFAKSVKMPPSRLSEIKSGKVKSISAETALEISKKYNINLEWLLNNEGEMFLSEEHKEDEGLLKVSIDYKNSGSCGCGAFIDEGNCPDTIYISKFWIKNILRASTKDLMFIFAEGDSMEPKINDGDMLLIDKTQTEPKNGVYLIRFDNELFVKRIQLFPDKIELLSDNSNYKPIEIKKHELDGVTIVGRVVWNGSKKNV